MYWEIYLSFSGHTGYFLYLFIALSTVLCLTQIAFQIFLSVVGNEIIAKCEFLEILLRHVGLVRLDELDALNITKWIAPEVLAFFGSIIIAIVLRRSSALNEQILSEEIQNGNHPESVEVNHELGLEKWRVLVRAGKILSLLALCATGALQPSVLSVVYYLIFLIAATWWGMNKQLSRYDCLSIFIIIFYLQFRII
jgi:piezo-type mechanosensitive ion channel component 1/2